MEPRYNDITEEQGQQTKEHKMSEQNKTCTTNGCDNPRWEPDWKCGECHHEQMIDCQWDYEVDTWTDDE